MLKLLRLDQELYDQQYSHRRSKQMDLADHNLSDTELKLLSDDITEAGQLLINLHDRCIAMPVQQSSLESDLS